MGKAKFTSAEGCAYASDLSQASQYTQGGRELLPFYPFCRMALCSKEGAQVHRILNYLRFRVRGRTDMTGEHGHETYGWCTQRQRG
jgi:hypothetical protein